MPRKSKRKRRNNSYATTTSSNSNNNNETKVENAIELQVSSARIVDRKSMKKRESFFKRRSTSKYTIPEAMQYKPSWYKNQNIDFQTIRKAIEIESGGIVHISNQELNRVSPFSDTYGSNQRLFHEEVSEFAKYFIHYYRVVKELALHNDPSNNVQSTNPSSSINAWSFAYARLN